MEIATFKRLQKLNQLRLTENEEQEILAFFDKAEDDAKLLDTVNTDSTERMVHVMPLTNVLRDDVEKKLFTRDELQKSAPEATDGYWQVPRLVE